MTAGPSQSKARDVRAMFGRIARRYDLMNALMTLGRHNAWRRRTAAAALSSHAPLSSRAGEGLGVRPLALDIGSGTGDLALALRRAGAARVVAADFSDVMLFEAQSKLARATGNRHQAA